MTWATLMTAFGLFGLFSDRIAFGPPREVDLSEEVIVITGGVEGLGGLLAETYGMRNANIAVLDTKTVTDHEAEEKGVVYYQCDVSNEKQVEAAAAKIVDDVSFSSQENDSIAYKHSSEPQRSLSTTLASSNLSQFWNQALQTLSGTTTHIAACDVSLTIRPELCVSIRFLISSLCVPFCPICFKKVEGQSSPFLLSSVTSVPPIFQPTPRRKRRCLHCTTRSEPSSHRTRKRKKSKPSSFRSVR